MSHNNAELVPHFPWLQPNGIWATYDMHCHCGAVKYTIKMSPPLYKEQTEGKEQYEGVECECSICERDGYLMVHPLAENINFIQGEDELSQYRFGSKQSPHSFCRNCGSSIGANLTTMLSTLGQPARWAINLRMLKDYDRSKLLIKRVAGMKDFGPKYEV